jgi:hypothetical protein
MILMWISKIGYKNVFIFLFILNLEIFKYFLLNYFIDINNKKNDK